MPEGGGPHVPTNSAAHEPPGAPVEEKAAPMEMVIAPDPHELNWCKMMSRCPQQSAADAEGQSEFVVSPWTPPYPSEYIQ